ncbi:dihydrofolate reductase family protein [Agromyces mediolanus]|uniref:dihydrofolate reductase family protein n=1 Tax=Agromyces mediolanus TaxID=41986 RepID=UPI00383625EC
MAGTVFFSVSVSLDGYLAPDSPDELMGRQWMQLQQWVFRQKHFRENLKLGTGGEEGRDNEIVRDTFERTGASVMGRRMFDAGEEMWPADPPFHTPVFVVTHSPREPWVRDGGTTFFFVTDGVESAVAQARAAAGPRDVRVAGGADVIVQALNAGLVDEFHLAVSPVFFGTGVRLFDRIDAAGVGVEQIGVEPSPHTTHLRYAVRRG